MQRYCDSVNGDDLQNYKPVERREAASKGGKEASKKSAPQHSSTKGSTATPRPPSSHAQRNNNDVSSLVNTSIQPAKTSSKPSIAMAAFEEPISELKLSVDTLENERDFYFGKLRDIEILCQTPKIENLPIVAAIKRILYATDYDDASVAEALSPIGEVSEKKGSFETPKRKNILSINVDAAGSTTLSPRQRLSDASDVHCSGSLLMSY